jgi:type VI secretion system Hcp family effector
LALFGYLRVTNASGLMLEGDCCIDGHKQWIPIWGGHHGVQLPTSNSGLPNGKRVHLPLTLNKHVDRTTPVFHSYLNRGDRLKEIVIDWYRVNTKTSQTEAYFRQTLNNVHVSGIDVSVQQHAQNTQTNETHSHNSVLMESVQFIYENIIWTFIDGGIEFEDNLKPQQPKPAKQKPQKPAKKPHRVLWQPECKDQLPIPIDYRATLLVYGVNQDRNLCKQTHNLAHDTHSRTFTLTNSEQFETYFIAPHMQAVLDDLETNRNVKQSVSDGLISPVILQGSDITSKGNTLHYAPVNVDIKREIQIRMQSAHGNDLRFELKGGADVSHAIAANEQPKAPLRFDQLDGTQSFSLNSIEADLPAVEIIPNIPLKDWLDQDKLREHGIGSKGGPQLLDYRLEKGHIPQLTLIPQPPQFGLFFDGTGNNKTNDNVDVNDDKEPTNVAKLSELYLRDHYSYSYYEEGIGTQAHKQDSATDMGMAYSLNEHINKALIEVKDYFQKFKNCTVGFIDVFGFSRGATQARMMVNIIHYLNEQEPDYWGGPKLVVRFVGIYDTVGSVGVGGDNDNEWCFATGELPGSPTTATLDIAATAACAVHHLAALDEQRENFPLSSLKTSENSTLPTHFTEEGVPGAHADVGGGYGNGASTIHYPLQKLDYEKREATPSRLNADKQRLKQALESAYYRPGIHIEFETTSWVDHQNSREGTSRKMALKPYWQRQVSNQIALIHLAAMHKKALEYGVPFKPLNTLDLFRHSHNNERLYQYDTPAALEQLCQHAVTQGVSSQAYKDLSEHYIHHSHRHTGLTDTIAFSPESNPKHAFGHYGREVFYAQNTGLGDQGTWQLHTNSQGIIQWYKA